MLITSASSEHRVSSSVLRFLYSYKTFGWLLSLAICSRVFYPEPVQLCFFVLFFTYAWSMPSLRAGILSSLTALLRLFETRLLILLAVCSLIATASTPAKDQQLTMWLNFFLLLIGFLGSCSCLSLLKQKNDSLRRIFRMVTICFTISMLIWLALLLLLKTIPRGVDYFGKDYLRSWFLYLLYSQSGIVVLFFPLLFATFSRYGIGLSTSCKSRLFWRICISLGLLFFLLFALITERRIIALSLLVAGIVAIVALFDKKKIDRRLILFAGLCILCLSILFLYYLRSHAPIYQNKSELCAECNELFLPWWLVDNSRQFAWRETINVWLENPWFGRGVHNDLTSFDHPHSRFLQILSGFGIVGFSVFALLLFCLLARSFLQWRKERRLSSLSMLLVHSVYWSIGIFELSVWSAWHFWVYIFTLALSLSLDRLPPDEVSVKR